MTDHVDLLARADGTTRALVAGGLEHAGGIVAALAAALRATLTERDAARTAIGKVLYRNLDGKIHCGWYDDVDMLTEIGLTPAEVAEVDGAVPS